MSTQPQATKREVELELQIWRERMNAIQNAVQSLNVQAQLFQMQAKECQEQVARLEAAAKALATPPEEKHDAAGKVEPIRPASIEETPRDAAAA